MKRFLAVVGLVAFVAACSDSNVTSPASHLRPGVASRDVGDPPPPPLGGDFGEGDLTVGPISTDVVANALPTSVCSYAFPHFVFSWSYLQANGSTSSPNQVVHLNLTSGASGNIDLHDIQNGKIITHGTVSDASNNSFTIQGTNFLDISSEGFTAEVTGTLTDPSGAKCQATAELSGEFLTSPPPPPTG
jgi:hypothetical protein